MGMLDIKQLRILEDLGIIGLRELKKVGGSYALFLPKSWVDTFCLEINGTYWFRLNVNSDGSITFSQFTQEELEQELSSIQIISKQEK